jgi:hypothetical protein
MLQEEFMHQIKNVIPNRLKSCGSQAFLTRRVIPPLDIKFFFV